MKNKYAIITTASQHYFMGLNAILNGIDYYEHKDVDVYVVTEELLNSYLELCRSRFSFPINSYMCKELCEKDSYVTEDYNWAKYRLIQMIGKDYDALLYLDADCMITANISQWLNVAAESGKLLIPQSPQTGAVFSDVHKYSNPQELDIFLTINPIKNFIFFMDAKKHMDIIDYCWNERNNPRLIKDSTLETYFFGRGVYDLNKESQLMILDSDMWIADHYMAHSIVSLEHNEKYRLVNPEGKELKIVHGRYWNKSWSKNMLDSESVNRHSHHYECIFANITNHTKLMDFFNYDCKVSLDEVEKMNEGIYARLINM